MKVTLGHDPAMARMVERQMCNWEHARQQRDAPGPPNPLELHDFICISREVEVGPSLIGAMVAERLEWPLIDKEVLHAMAGDDALREQVYTSLDERHLSWCEETLRSLMHSEFSRNDYFHQLGRTVVALARQGNAVFVGRRADLILPRDLGLRVRLIAPLEMRIRLIMERLGLSEPEAIKELRRLEEERAAFIKQYFKVSPDDPSAYDLVINLRRVSPDQTVDMILAAHKFLASAG